MAEALESFTLRRCLDQDIQKILLFPHNFEGRGEECVKELAGRVVSGVQNKGSLEVQVGQYLNESQYQAVLHACTQRLTIVEGPRRSGKKRVLLKVLTQFVAGSADKILVVTDSLETTQKVVQAMREKGFSLFHEVVGEHLNEVTLKNETPFTAQFGPRSSLKKALLRDRIFVTDFSNCQFSYLKNCDFKRVVFYNSQALTELECLPALVKNVSQCVLFGDRHQYSSRLKERGEENILSSSRGFKTSLLQKLVDSGVPVSSLSTQYNPPHIIGNEIWKFLRKNYYPFWGDLE
jgi:hypothetical protein